METKTKSGFNVIQMVEIPENQLSKGILKELEGRELYTDSDGEIDEKIYSADIFEAIAGEQYEMPQTSPLLLSDADLKTLDALSRELEEYELVRINKI